MLPVGDLPLKIQPDYDESRKQCVLVKLTDASVKSIEEFLKNKNSTSKKPTISFQRDRGEIILPIDAKSTEPNKPQYKKFHFVLSSVKESNKDSSATFECISYANSKLKTLGTIEQRMTVQAVQDDVFQATKERVNKEVEEEKKNATKEIKPSGALVNRNSSIGSNLNNMNRPKPMNNPKPVSANVSLNTSAPNASNPSMNNDLNKFRPPVLDRPLKERLIHLLALKPQTKLDIMTKLNKDNSLTDKEKDSLEALIHAVSNFNPKTSTYEIQNEVMLNEVKENWPFYSQTEKLMVKNNISKLKQAMASAAYSLQNSMASSGGLSSSVSSSSLHKNSQQQQAQMQPSSAFVSLKNSTSTSSLNRPSNNNNLDDSASKVSSSFVPKQRISPLKNTPDQFKPIIPSSNSNKISPSKAAVPSNSHANKDRQQQVRISDAFNLSPSSDLDLSNENSFNMSGNSGVKKQPEKEKDHNSTSSNNSSNPPSKRFKSNFVDRQKEIEQTEVLECQKRYTKVMNRKQRDQYQTEIDQIYDEYLDLHQYIESVSAQFQKYQQELNLIRDETSKEYEDKRNKIVGDYVEKQNDAEYAKKRERYSRVYIKLKFINDLCKQFDNTVAASTAST